MWIFFFKKNYVSHLNLSDVMKRTFWHLTSQKEVEMFIQQKANGFMSDLQNPFTSRQKFTLDASIKNSIETCSKRREMGAQKGWTKWWMIQNVYI